MSHVSSLIGWAKVTRDSQGRGRNHWQMETHLTQDGGWTARRSNQSVLKEINPEYSLKGLVLKLKLQYFGHMMGRAGKLEKALMLGKIEGRRRKRG